MAARRPRKLTILEIIVLIAAIAVGLAWAGYYQKTVNWEGRQLPKANPAFWQGVTVASDYLGGTPHLFSAVSIGLLIVRLGERPRKSLRQLTRLPGTVAAGAALIAISIDIAHEVLEISLNIILTTGTEDRYDFRQLTFLTLSNRAPALAILVAWALLAIGGRWRREPGWPDGLGMILGVAWMLAAATESLLHCLWNYHYWFTP